MIADTLQLLVNKGGRAYVQSLWQAWNDELSSIAQAFRANHSDVVIDVMDVVPLFNRILNNPHQYNSKPST